MEVEFNFKETHSDEELPDDQRDHSLCIFIFSGIL